MRVKMNSSKTTGKQSRPCLAVLASDRDGKYKDRCDVPRNITDLELNTSIGRRDKHLADNLAVGKETRTR